MKKVLSSMKVAALQCLVAGGICATAARADDFDFATSPVEANGPSLTASNEPFGAGSTPCEACGDCATCSDCCSDCCNCGPPGQFWFRQEYVGWWARGGRVPALVSTTTNGTLPATTPLYGDATYNGRYRSGTYTQGGMWFDCCHNWGVQGEYFFVGRESSPFFASSDGDPVLARPFTDANTGDPSQELIAFPGRVVGSVSVRNYNSLAGGGVFLRRNLCCWSDCCDNACDDGCGCGFCGQDCCRLDCIFGYRTYRFNDNLGVNERLTSIDPTSGTAVGTQFNVTDSFRTLNSFNGFEIGLIADRYRGRWMYEGAARIAVGNMQQIVAINGRTVVSFPGQPTAFDQGGILALSSNIGRYTHDSFTAVPQLAGRIGYRLTERLTFLVGYTAIFIGQVARAGDQIDTVVNPNLIPPVTPGGPNRPSFTLHTSDLWLQGITLGGEYYF